jgi:hypothetical protein
MGKPLASGSMPPNPATTLDDGMLTASRKKQVTTQTVMEMTLM